MKSKPICWFLILFLNLFSSWITCCPSSFLSAGPACDYENTHDALCCWQTLGGSANNSWHRTTNGTIGADMSMKHRAWFTTSQLDRNLNNNKFQYLASMFQLKAKSTYCLSFWYYLQAVEDSSSIDVLRFISADLPAEQLKGDAYRTLFSTVQRNGLEWTRQQLRIVPPELGSFSDGHESTSSPDYNLMFIGKLQNARSSIALDDIRLIEGECPVVDNFCDFERDTCGWVLNGTELSTDYFDHTTGSRTGHLVRIFESYTYDYKYDYDGLEANKTGSMSKSMSTLTNIFDNNSDRKQPVCIQFFYYMGTGENAESHELVDPNATISIKVQQSGAENMVNYTITLMDTYNSGNLVAWAMFRANFEATKKTTIEIESSRQALATLYVDDISFVAGQCETDGNCDFETDMCGWQNNPTWPFGDEYGWLRVPAKSSYIQGAHLGQDRTTTTTSGHYAIYPLEMIDVKTLANFSSPLIINNKLDKMCFTMWYFVQTRDTLMEAIEVRLKDIRQRRSTSTHATGTHSLEWKLFSVQFHNLPERFQIQIRVLNHENILSNVGLDDIRLVSGDC